MTYTITVESPHKPTETFTRKRRDAAEYLFRHAVYDVLKSRALLDRPCAHRAMLQAREVRYPDCTAVSVGVQDVVIRFRAAA